jgi:hypothetical protein
MVSARVARVARNADRSASPDMRSQPLPSCKVHGRRESRTGTPSLASTVRVDGQVVRLLLGESTLDPRLAGPTYLAEPVDVALDNLPLEAPTRSALPPVEALADSTAAPRLYLQGPPGSGQLRLAGALAAAAGLPLLVVDLARAPGGHGEGVGPEEFVRLVFREAWFRGTAVLVDGVGEPEGDASERVHAALHAEVARSRVLTMLAGRDRWLPAPAGCEGPAVGVVTVPCPAPHAPTRRACWQAALGPAGLPTGADLAAPGSSHCPGSARKLEATTAERRRLIDLYQAGLLELPELQRRAAEVEHRRRDLDQRRDALNTQRQELTRDNQLRRRVRDFATRVLDVIDTLDFDQKQCNRHRGPGKCRRGRAGHP